MNRGLGYILTFALILISILFALIFSAAFRISYLEQQVASNTAALETVQAELKQLSRRPNPEPPAGKISVRQYMAKYMSNHINDYDQIAIIVEPSEGIGYAVAYLSAAAINRSDLLAAEGFDLMADDATVIIGEPCDIFGEVMFRVNHPERSKPVVQLYGWNETSQEYLLVYGENAYPYRFFVDGEEGAGVQDFEKLKEAARPKCEGQ